MLIGYFLWACFLPSFLWFHIYALGVYICFYKIIINYWSNFWYTFILMSSSFVLTFSKERYILESEYDQSKQKFFISCCCKNKKIYGLSFPVSARSVSSLRIFSTKWVQMSQVCYYFFLRGWGRGVSIRNVNKVRVRKRYNFVILTSIPKKLL